MLRILALCGALLLAPTIAVAGPHDEIPASAYGGLFALKQISPSLFREKLLPLIDEAMKDGKITFVEMDIINAEAGSMGKAFHKAARSKSVEESLGDYLKKAEAAGIDITDALNQALRSGEMSKLFDGAVEMFRKPDGAEKNKAPQKSGTAEQPVEL